MKRALVLTLLVGCGRVAFDGQTDAARDDASDDALGVASCPGMATVFDEDGDFVGDPCDVCPHLVDDQTDGDSDGVGDACDFEPAAARQRILFFDGFNAERAEWNYGGTVTGGQLVIPVLATDANNVLDVPTSVASVTISGTILEVGALTTHLFVAMKPVPNESYYMEMINDGPGRRRSLMYQLDAMYTELAGMTNTGTPIQPGPFTLELDARASQMLGHIETVGAAPVGFVATGTPTISSARMLLYMRNLSVVFDYAIVIETF